VATHDVQAREPRHTERTQNGGAVPSKDAVASPIPSVIASREALLNGNRWEDTDA